MSINFESIACPACDGPHSEPFAELHDRFDVLPGQSYQLVRCTNCDLLFLNPRPDAQSIGPYYATDQYDPFGSDDGAQSLASRLYQIARPLSIRRKAARVVGGLKPGSRTLDVGCATGEFMLEMRRRGYEPCGVEPDTGAAHYANEKLGLTVWQGGIEQVPSDAGFFRLISFWHVLEHVHRLKENLARSFELLERGGQVSIAVPNPDSWDAKVYGTRWVAWDAPRHLYHFRPRVMMKLLTDSGFKPRHAGAVAFDAFYHCLLSEKTLPGYVRGGLRGGVSYLRGLIGKNGSSELYIATKP